MTAITADGANASDFLNDAYTAPSADLIDHDGDAVPNKAFSIQGRMGVFSHLARMALALVVMGISVAPMMGVAGMAEANGGTPNVALMVIAGALMAFGVIGGAVYMLFNTIKRLHDLNMSGWFFLINFIPLVGMFFSAYVTLMPGKKEGNQFAGATKPTSTAGYIVGGIMLALYALSIVANIALVSGVVAA